MAAPRAALVVLLCFPRPTAPQAPPTLWQSTWLAGNAITPTAGYSDAGTGLLNSPRGVLALPSGAYVIADRSNNMVRQAFTNGTIKLLAGSPTMAAGFLDGVGTNALFNWPVSFAFQPFSNSTILLTGEYNNGIIRRLHLGNASVVTVAGTPGSTGWVDGPCSTAKMNTVFALVASPTTGAVFWTESTNFVIRKLALAPACSVTTFAGWSAAGNVDGIGTNSNFTNPRGLALDDAGGMLYVADTTALRIRAISVASQAVTTLVGGSAAGYRDGAGAAALLTAPLGLLFVDGGTPNAALLVTDGNALRRVRVADGFTTTAAGATASGFADGVGAAVRFNGPCGLAQALDGSVLIADTSNHGVRRMTQLACPAGSFCAPPPAAVQVQLVAAAVCPAGSFCPAGSAAPLPCPPNSRTLYAGATMSAACTPAVAVPPSANCTLGAPAVSPFQLIAIPGVSDAAPLLLLPAAHPLNAQGADWVLASPAACAAYASTLGAVSQCDGGRVLSFNGVAYSFLGSAAALGMVAAGPTCGA